MSEGLVKAMRNKKWSEMTDPERIISLQKELIRTQRHLKNLSTYVNRLIGHDHLNGKLVNRIEQPNEESYGGLYFRVEEFEECLL